MSSFSHYRFWKGFFIGVIINVILKETLKKSDYRIDEDIFVFMIYNWDIPFEKMELKRVKCWEWKVQIID